MDIDRLAKDRSRARIDGGVYEFKLAGLAAARLRALHRKRPDLRFLLATNVDGANPFDDIVLRLKWRENGRERVFTYFVQLKHKENVEKPVSEKELIGKPNQRTKDFNLRYYFTKYVESVKNTEVQSGKHKTNNQRQLREWLRNDFRLVLLTTRDVFPDKKPRNASSAFFPFEEIFQTNQGEAFSFDENDSNVWNMFEGTSQQEIFRHDFLQRLRIVSGQAQASGLEHLLSRAMEDALGGPSTRMEQLLSQYSTFLHKWWESDEGDCLSADSSEIEDLIMEDINSQIYPFHFHQRYYSALAQRIREWDVTYVIVPGISSRLRCAMFKRVLENNHRGHFVMFTDSTFQEYPITALETVCSKICDDVVLSTDNTEILCEFLNKLLPVKNCKVRVISSEWNADVYKVLTKQTSQCNTWSEYWKLEHANFEEQRTIMSRKVSFQGHEMPLSFLEGVWPSLRQGVAGAMLCALALGEPVVLGTPLPPLESIYLPRTVEHRVALHPSVFEMRSLKDHFLLSGFPDEILDKLRDPESPWQECLPSGAPVATCDVQRTGWGAAASQIKPLAILSYMGKRASRTVWREWDPQKESDRRDGKSRLNVHWLTYERKEIIWNYTNGDSKCLQKYIQKTMPNCKDQPLCTHNGTKDFLEWKNSTVLLTDIAGMGKSMFVTQMAHTMKDARKTHWVVVVRMSEGRVMSELPTQIELNHVLELLKRFAVTKKYPAAAAASHFLEDSLLKTGSIEVLVDGVDEVCPVHKDKALRILAILQHTLEENGGRLWVAARKMLEEDLANTLRCSTPLSLRPFTPRDQQRYLVRHWKTSLKGIKEKEFESRVGVLVNAVRQATGSGDRSLCDVPLYTCMLAKAYEGNEIFPLISDTKIDLVSSINRLTLYKKFVHKTLGMVWDKVGISESERENLGISNDNVVLEKHKLYAAMDCFNDKKLMGACYEKAKDAVKELEDDTEREKIVKKGIISDFVDGKPSFTHRTISEFMAAQWLQDRFYSLPVLTQALYNGEFGEVRYFFDALMAEGHPLHEATLSGRMLGVTAALINPDRLNEEDRGGRRAVHIAAIYGHEQIVRVLLEAGSETNARDKVLSWTPLRYADATLRFPSGKWDWLSLKKDALPQLSAAEQLLCFRAKSRDTTNIIKQENLLEYAFRKDYAEISKILVKKSGPIFIQKLRGENFMHRAAFQGSRRVVAMLINSGFAVNSIEKNRGDTPLHVAAQEGLKDVCELLLQNGASINKADKNGDTPLHRASQEGHDSLCTLFLNKKANMDAKDSMGRTALHEAAVRGHETVCRALLESGAEVNLRDSREVSVLHEAARWGHASLCRYLLDKGADAAVFNLRGESAYDLAKRHEHEDVCDVLRSTRPKSKNPSVRN